MQAKPTHVQGTPIPYNESLGNLSNQLRKGGMDTWTASIALGYNPSDEALKILIRGMKSQSADLRRAAAGAIKHHPNGKRAGSELVKLLEDGSDTVTRAACESLAALLCAEAHDDILPLLDSPDPMTREAGVRAIARLWKSSDFDILVMLHEKDKSLNVRDACAWALRDHANADTWKQLFNLWKAHSLARHRAWTCELAGEYGDDSSMTELEQLSQDKDGHVRKAANRA